MYVDNDDIVAAVIDAILIVWELLYFSVGSLRDKSRHLVFALIVCTVGIHCVADGDITKETTDEDLEYYCEDDNFAELMYYFLRRMKAAEADGLYVDGVVSKKPE